MTIKRRINILLFLIMCGLIGACYWVRSTKDRVAPVITVPEREVTYTEGAGTEVLLAGLSATDDKDGDCTKDIHVYDISAMDDGEHALVIYAVYDKAYNLGKATETVNYRGSDAQETATAADAQIIPVTPDTEADITTEAADMEKKAEEGYDDPPLISHGAPVIRLKTHELKLEVGEDFDPITIVEKVVDDDDEEDDLIDGMYFDGRFDIDKAGTYEVWYYCEDSDENLSNTAKLRIIVGDESNLSEYE